MHGKGTPRRGFEYAACALDMLNAVCEWTLMQKARLGDSGPELVPRSLWLVVLPDDGLDLSSVSVDIDVLDLPKESTSVVSLATAEQHGQDDEGDVGGEEVGDDELWRECLETLDEDDDSDEEGSVVCTPWHELSLEWQVVTGDTTVLQSGHKSDVGDTDEDPGTQTSQGGDVDQPVEGGVGVVVDD